ncbi:MAG: hypothetical protein HY862_16515 [Chloroflexi bacterium]|nr:hypothetical protein [Chloroflexota bacterium]
MATQVFVTNLPLTSTEDDVQALFGQAGEVVGVKLVRDQQTGENKGFGFVHMASDEAAQQAIDIFNGFEYEGQKILVRESRPQRSKKERMDARRQFADELADKLNESNPKARFQLRRIVETQGRTFAQRLLDETLKIEEEGGMMTLDGTRRRTIGGVYLYLAWQNVPIEIRDKIFPDRARLKKRADQKKRQNTSESGEEVANEVEEAEIQAEPPAPAIPTAELIERLAELRDAEQLAEKKVEDIRARRAPGGLFSALKDVAEIKNQINALLKEYPGLE